ncbi:MAG: GNAT family N-acetyltransferase, partial [Nannocystaceae bacterium]
MREDVTITVGTLDRVAALADAMRSMWLDNGVSPGSIIPDYRDEVRRFVERGAREDGLVFFLAEDGDAVVGAACCQRFAGLYPAILTPDVRRYGYLWGVYVGPDYRRAGLGRRLTERC